MLLWQLIQKNIMNILKVKTAIKNIKELKKGLPNMEYENYAERIKPLIDFKTYKKPKPDIKDFVRISVKKGEMSMYSIKKNKFSQLNDKRFYFPNAIVSVPFGHFSLAEIDEYKKDKGQRTEKYFWTDKEKLLELEKKAIDKIPEIFFLNHILEQIPKIVSASCTKFDRNTKFLYKEELQQNIIEYILGAEWKKNIPTMDNSVKTS